MKRDSEMTGRDRMKRQVAKYAARSTPEYVAATLGAKQAEMTRKYEAQADVLCHVHVAVQAVTDRAGVPGWQRLWYKVHGSEAYKLWRLHRDIDISVELGILRHKWTMRGLDPDLLVAVETAVLNELARLDAESGDAASVLTL